MYLDEQTCQKRMVFWLWCGNRNSTKFIKQGDYSSAG